MQDRIVLLGFILLLTALAASCTLPAAAAVPAAPRVTVVDTGAQPLKVHDRSDGWAEYPALASSNQYIVLAYSMNTGEGSEVYCHVIHRENGEETRWHPTADTDGNGFRPSLDILGGAHALIAWTSYDDSEWKIRAFANSFTACGTDGRLLEVSDRGGFNSQVRVECGEAAGWFTWTNWHDGRYSVLARRCTYPGFELHDAVTVYEGANPVGRPDILVLEDNHIVVAWDEYTDGRFAVRAREIAGGEAGPARNISGTEHSFAWGPHLAGTADDILVVWQAVPGGLEHGEPRAGTFAGGEIEYALGRPGDDETWRVRSLTGPAGSNVIAWATRRGYRRTHLYMKSVSEEGTSRTVQVEFPMRRTFINWFDCRYDGRLVLAYEYSGSMYLYDFESEKLDGALATVSPAEEARMPTGAAPEPRADVSYTTEYDGKMLNAYFGDYHNHTSFSDGRAYPDISYLTARDYRRLDFMGVSDHDDTTTPGEFAWNLAVCDCLTENGEYICLYGYEENRGWAQNGYGHWNALLRKKDTIFHFAEDMTPDDLYGYAKRDDVILIPHHIGVVWAPHNWDYFDAVAEPVVEVCSIHGIYDNLETCADTVRCVEGSMLVDGLDRGYRFGIVGGSDFHNCFSAIMNEHSLTGVYAEELTREHILDAIKKRRTFATTGDKIIVDFRCNGRFMGETISGGSRLEFTAHVESADPITSAELIRGGRVVITEEVDAREASYTWSIENPGEATYFYLRLATRSGEFAWSSPIFVEP